MSNNDAFVRETVYFVQSRDKRFHKEFWSEWNCCSPHFATRKEADRCFEAQDNPGKLWPEEWRLVRGTFWHERVPIKTPLYCVSRRRITELARRSS